MKDIPGKKLVWGEGDGEMVGVPHTSVSLSSASCWAPSTTLPSTEGASETWVVGASQEDGLFPSDTNGTTAPVLVAGAEPQSTLIKR